MAAISIIEMYETKRKKLCKSTKHLTCDQYDLIMFEDYMCIYIIHITEASFMSIIRNSRWLSNYVMELNDKKYSIIRVHLNQTHTGYSRTTKSYMRLVVIESKHF